jgi:hypothetical protein
MPLWDLRRQCFGQHHRPDASNSRIPDRFRTQHILVKSLSPSYPDNTDGLRCGMCFSAETERLWDEDYVFHRKMKRLREYEVEGSGPSSGYIKFSL